MCPARDIFALSGPVKFRLAAQLAKDGDALDDGTVAWPADRELVELGTLSLTSAPEDQQVYASLWGHKSMGSQVYKTIASL